MAFEKETQKLESKIIEMEGKKYASNQQAEEYGARITEIEASKNSLEVLLKEANDQRTNITPLTKNSLLLMSKIYHVQVNIMEEVFNIRKVEARLQEISFIATKFKDKTQEIVEIIQG